MTATQVMQPKTTLEDRTEATRPVHTYSPTVDIVEQSTELTLFIDMPGTRADNVDIDFENGVLTVHGRVEQRQSPDIAHLQREYGIGDFHRTFRVSEVIDASGITAEFANGVLTVHLPKVSAAQPRKIAVKATK